MLRLRTFGGAALLDDDRVLTGTAAQKRRLALLGMLAAAGQRGMSRDKLGSLLWPESDQERARHSLSQWLFTTRRDLKAEDLFIGTTELRLNPDRITTDVGEFDRALEAKDLEKAVACYAGPFLDGFHLTGAPEFERWADGERARLATSFEKALETMAAQRAAAGDARGALELWRRLAAADPYNGRVSLALMRAFEASGDVAGALTHARVHATLLKEELGAEPQPDVVAYAEQLRRAPAASAAAREPAAPRAHPPTATDQAAGQPAAATPSAVAPRPAADPASLRLPSSFGRARRRRRMLRRGAFVLTGALFLLLATWAAVPAEARERLLTLVWRPEARILSRRIVVAPLEDFSSNRSPALDRFGLYAADWIAGELAEAEVFDVVDAKTSYMNDKVVARLPRLFRDGDRSVALAKESGAGLLVHGSFAQDGDSIRVQVSLTDVAADRVIGSQKVAGLATDKHRIADELAKRVVTMAAVAVDTSVAGGAIRTTYPSSLASFAETIEAWERYAKQDIDGFYRHAQRASRFDSTYMMPVLMQAYMRSDSREWHVADSLVRILEAHRGTMSKIEREGTDMLRAAVNGEMEGHLHGALAVIKASPASPEVRTYAARVAVNANRPALALAILDSVDPSRGILLAAPWYWNWASAAHHLRGEHALERERASTGYKRFPSMATTVANHGRALAVRGDVAALRALLDDLPRAGEPNANRRWKIAIDWARELRAHGHAPEARVLLERILADLSSAAAQRNAAADGFRATVLGDLGRSADAHAIWQRVAAREPESLEALGNLAVAAARARDLARARAIETQIAQRAWPYAHGRNLMWRARIAAALGQPEQAVALVEEALGRGYSRFFDPAGGLYDEPDVHADPALESLRRLPSFNALITPKG